jgi:hypothetical protein
MGCIGMSMEDFCRCTPSEFYGVWHAWSEREQRLERGAWERMRMECLCSLQPHSKKKLAARDLMTFPWEKEAEREKETLTAEELRERMERAKARYGLR